MASIWAKVDALLPVSAKAHPAGFLGTMVFANLILINKAHSCDGLIPPGLCSPGYLARYLQIDREIEEGNLQACERCERPERSRTEAGDIAKELVRIGLKSAAREKLIALDADGCTLLGWDETWGEKAMTNAERGRKYREKQKNSETERKPNGANETERQCAANARLEQTRLEQTRVPLSPEKNSDELESLVCDLARLAAGAPLEDETEAFRAEVEGYLDGAGWALDREVEVAGRGDGKSGRVDLVATRNGASVGVEIDFRKPRKKSVAKLSKLDMPAVILLRGQRDRAQRSGVTVIGLPVRGGLACLIPGSWRPTEEHHELARARGVDASGESENFRDHHIAKGSTMKDWDAAFRTWLRNAAKWAKPSQKNTGRAKPMATGYAEGGVQELK